MTVNDLLAEVLKDIKPKDRKLLKEVDSFLDKLNTALARENIKAKAVVGGSIAKDTYLTGNHDCDVFVKFDYSYMDDDLSGILKKVLKPFKPSLVHGSRDYFMIRNGISYEIVPVLSIRDPKKAMNVTDMSPLHVTWVKKHKGFNDDIRLAKQFCKAAGVYGAESYIKGFSGHVLDILVIHYRGFLPLLRASQKWKDKEVIDPEKYYRNNALQKLNRSKIDSPIIVIDPVLPERNAAAALSGEKLKMFRDAASEFLKSPSKEAFAISDTTLEDIRAKAGRNKLIVLDVSVPRGKDDVIGARLLKAFTLINNRLKFNDFVVRDSGWTWNHKQKGIFWFIIDPKDLFPITKWCGPPIKEKERVKSFRIKHKKTFTEDGRICTYMKRKHVNADTLIRDVIKDPLLKEKVKDIRLCEV